MKQGLFLVFSLCSLTSARRVCDGNLTCDDHALLQHTRAGKQGTWAFPRNWKTARDLANITHFNSIHWATVDGVNLSLMFYSAIPVFGADGNYIAMLQSFNTGQKKPLEYLVRTGALSLFCSGPVRSHRTKVRIVGNETEAAYKQDLIFICDWPEEEKHFDRFEVFLDDGKGNHLGSLVAERKAGLLKHYGTVACVREVYPNSLSGFRLLPQWLEFSLLHGVDHFIIYTVNLDSEILVDLWEPYIQKGLATRVHFNREIEGHNPYAFHSRMVGPIMEDCLYRAKGHAKWLLPSVDIDEYPNVKDGSLFPGGEVPDNYLATSWDAIAKDKGFEPDQVHSIAFPLYRFGVAEKGQVELSSVFREDNVQRTCPKYILNPKTSWSTFTHWVASWDKNTVGLHLAANIGAIHHYREPHPYAIHLHIDANHKDDSMLKYVPELSSALKDRYDEDTQNFLLRLGEVREVESKEEAEAELSEDPYISAWLESIYSSTGISIVTENLTCDDHALLQHSRSSNFGKQGTWALPRNWKTARDLANITDFEAFSWASDDGTYFNLRFTSVIPVFGSDGNYIAMLQEFHENAHMEYYVRTGTLSLFCSGPDGSHRTKVRVIGNETDAAYKVHLVFICDWPEEEKHLETFEVFLEDGQGKNVGKVVAEQKTGLLKKYGTVACIREVYPNKLSGLRLLPQWMEFSLLHGIDHFMIYTINLDSEILVDLFEPYINKGVATRVHLHQDIVGDPFGFHSHLVGTIMQDCLYRVKNSADWVLPTVDIDEFPNVKNGDFFEGGRVPKDYLATSWDAIVKSQGKKRHQVHSISFPFYRFAPAESGQLDLSSFRREPQTSPVCPKYVMNPKVTHAIFTHWVVSWENGTEGIALHAKDGVIHHYREPQGYAIDQHIEANETDKSMKKYISSLSSSLAERYREETKAFLARLTSEVRPTLEEQRQLQLSSLEQEDEAELLAQNPNIRAWLQSAFGRTQMTRPPSAF